MMTVEGEMSDRGPPWLKSPCVSERPSRGMETPLAAPAAGAGSSLVSVREILSPVRVEAARVPQYCFL